MTFIRYAIYFVPRPDDRWAKFSAGWLGWDMQRGIAVAPPADTSLDVAAITAVPRRYGLHATLKPPFRLAGDQSAAALDLACAALAATRPQVVAHRLEIARMGRFLALMPKGDTPALDDLAAACVRELDRFRAPLTQSELDHRRASGLTPAREANLIRWGYPHVMGAFRFHITLTGKLDKATLAQTRALLTERLAPMLPVSFVVEDLALVGEAEDGRFHLIRRYALTG